MVIKLMADPRKILAPVRIWAYLPFPAGLSGLAKGYPAGAGAIPGQGMALELIY
jgi:hypothetical protein